MKPQFKYLVYDIETAIHKSLLNKVLYAGENLSDQEAYQKHTEELAKENRDFVNPSFHKPISIAAVALAEDFSIKRINLLGGVNRTTRSVVEAFWNIYNKNKPTLVDFNGKGFDVRVLELWAFQLGLPIDPRHFAQYGPRYRFSSDHIDLHEFLTNHGAIRFRGGLNLFAKLLGKPGKLEITGNRVQALFEEGKLFEIEDYCLCDTMDTYFVFLRTRVMTGQLTLGREKELVEEAKKKLEEKRNEEGYFKVYLENFGEWVPEG